MHIQGLVRGDVDQATARANLLAIRAALAQAGVVEEQHLGAGLIQVELDPELDRQSIDHGGTEILGIRLNHTVKGLVGESTRETILRWRNVGAAQHLFYVDSWLAGRNVRLADFTVECQAAPDHDAQTNVIRHQGNDITPYRETHVLERMRVTGHVGASVRSNNGDTFLHLEQCELIGDSSVVAYFSNADGTCKHKTLHVRGGVIDGQGVGVGLYVHPTIALSVRPADNGTRTRFRGSSRFAVYINGIFNDPTPMTVSYCEVVGAILDESNSHGIQTNAYRRMDIIGCDLRSKKGIQIQHAAVIDRCHGIGWERAYGGAPGQDVHLTNFIFDANNEPSQGWERYARPIYAPTAGRWRITNGRVFGLVDGHVMGGTWPESIEIENVFVTGRASSCLSTFSGRLVARRVICDGHVGGFWLGKDDIVSVLAEDCEFRSPDHAGWVTDLTPAANGKLTGRRNLYYQNQKIAKLGTDTYQFID